ncbi:hypothetical protein Prudu_012980 [Prunus dulcis]|uniref:Aminotransferase-like plant mobile domain-containing protein n=1 Tax=Prunus dulcis TaxID=3755 RepID=A0A4Y1RDX9_PRUDU|nr:hypothetical protein Prudu_012980 [Prunus dulcis]
MRTNNKCTEVGASHEGSVARRPQLQRVRKLEKTTPAKRISGPMGNGVFGVRVFIPRDRNPCSPLLHFDLEEHISFKLTLKKIRGCGNNDICATWYNKAMHDTVKAKVKESGFLPFLSILGHGKKGDRPLLVALAERWWDTTHTFHFDEVGEMTMTHGLRSNHRIACWWEAINNKVVKLFGKPIADLLAKMRVPYESLCTPYWKKNPKDDKEADQIARAFILCLIGSMTRANTGRSSSMGGYWRAWEVWACEYLKPFALSRPSGTLNTWPRTLRWVGAKSKRDLQHHLEHFRVMMRHLTNDQVNWNPWGTNESDMPTCRKPS